MDYFRLLVGDLVPVYSGFEADWYKAVRSGGFYVVTIAGLRQGLLVLYGEYL